MELPIISSCAGDVSVYVTIEEAVDDMEACDVVSGEYVLYDIAGSQLRLFVEKGKIHIEEGELDPSHTDEVRELLIHSLKNSITPLPSSNLTIRELVDLKLAYEASFYPGSQSPFWKRWLSLVRDRWLRQPRGGS